MTHLPAIIVGHMKVAKGAYSPHLDISEYDFWRVIAEALPPRTAHIIYRDNIGITKAYEQARVRQASFVVELHFNSFDKPTARGSEVLIGGGKLAEERKLAKAWLDQWFKLTSIPIRNGGIREVTPDVRGYSNMTRLNDRPCILIEPFFGSNLADCQAIERVGKHVIANSLASFLNAGGLMI